MQSQETHTQAGTLITELHEIAIARTSIVVQERGCPVERQVFTMTLGGETIQLLPFKNWGQLDHHKWLARGKLPATPAGLEITPEHIKLGGETISAHDPDACRKLEKMANGWLGSERSSEELARKRSNAGAPGPVPSAMKAAPSAPDSLGYRVEMDKDGQVHIRCFHGKELLAEVGLTVLGINGLVAQGLMHKPASFKVGAMHDWIEIDGVLYSFEKGRNDSDLLERVLNDHYLSNAALGHGKNVIVFTNAASSTGFDIQFDVSVGGVPDRRRRPLNEETLELLQDQNRCGVLQKNLVIKLTRPTLIFKRRTTDGGEEYLVRCPENIVTVIGDDGQTKEINLSQPVSYSHLSAVELTAVFNHPAINQHARLAPEEPRVVRRTEPPPAVTNPAPEPARKACVSEPRLVNIPKPEPPTAPAISVPSLPRSEGPRCEFELKPAMQPNAWLTPFLASTPDHHEGFTQLFYCKLAEFFGNSEEVQFGAGPCWTIALGDTNDPEDPAFHGIFLTEKGSLGFLNRGHIARFYKRVAFVGMQESALEGIDVMLIAVGLDEQQRLVFIVSDDFMEKFGVPRKTLIHELDHMKNSGAVILTRQQAIQSPEPIEVLWTMPDAETSDSEPVVVETRQPAAPQLG